MEMFKQVARKLGLVVGVFLAAAATTATLVLPADAASMTWSRWCNSSASDYDFKVQSPAGYIYTVPPGTCFAINGSSPVGDQYRINPGGGRHRVKYNSGNWSALRVTPTGYFKPANFSIITFNTYP